MIMVTKKTKKAFLVLAAVERGLFDNNVDASKKTNAELYSLIKSWDEEHIDNIGDDNGESKIEESKKDSSDKKRKLPKRDKKENAAKEEKVEQIMEQEPNIGSNEKSQKTDSVAEIVYDNPKPFRMTLLSLIRKNFGVNYSSLKDSKIPKKHYTHAIELLNESISNAMNVLSKVEEAEIVVHLVDKNGNVSDDKIYLHRDIICAEIERESQEKVVVDANKCEACEKQHEQHKIDELDTDGRTQEEKKMVNEILVSIGTLNAEVEVLRKENAELKTSIRKLEAKVENSKRSMTNSRNALINLMNKIANTKNERYVWVWKEIKSFVDHNLLTDDKGPLVLDIEKLIIEDSIRLREEAEAQRAIEARKAKALENDVTYEGNNISYIDGNVVRPDGVKKRVYNAYVAWYEDCESWVDYVIEQLETFDKIKVIAKRKKAISGLEIELDEWYAEWGESCDETVVDMVVDIMGDLVHSNVRNKEKALSDMVAIIDELELV